MYNEDVWTEVLGQISSGEFVRVIAERPGMPSVGGIKRKIESDSAFATAYAEARIEQSHAHAVMAARSATPETVQTARLQFDAERWIAGKLAPRTYGDKIQQEVQVSGTLDVNELWKETKEQLLERLRVLEEKRAGTAAPPRAKIAGKED